LLLGVKSLILQLPPLLHFLEVVHNPISDQLLQLLTPFDLPNQISKQLYARNYEELTSRTPLQSRTEIHLWFQFCK
jgi:hypothetical protein